MKDGRVREPVLDVLARDVVEERQRIVHERVLRDERRRLGVDQRRHGQRNDVAAVVADDVGIDLLGVDRLPAAPITGPSPAARRSRGPVVERRLLAARAARLRGGRLHPVAGAAEDRPERGAGEEQRADEQQQDPEDGRAGRAEREPDAPAEHLAEIAALVAAERDHQPEHEHGEPRPERAHVDERAPRHHQAAEHDEQDGKPPRRAADDAVEPVGESPADVAAVPAEVDDAGEERAERDEAQSPELRMLKAARLLRRGPALLDPAGSLGAQLAGALLARHAALFARRTADPPSLP